jgi:hypothetical protein
VLHALPISSFNKNYTMKCTYIGHTGVNAITCCQFDMPKGYAIIALIRTYNVPKYYFSIWRVSAYFQRRLNKTQISSCKC